MWNVDTGQYISIKNQIYFPASIQLLADRYLRCPFGLKISQDIYQAKMDQMQKDCEGAIGISDIFIQSKIIKKSR